MIDANVPIEMSDGLPNAKSSRHPDEREKIQRIIGRRSLGGLANDTKWNELIVAMRGHSASIPAYRWKCVDGVPVGWETEWLYHPPFPMISVEWMDFLFRYHPLRPGMSGPIRAAGEVEDYGDRIESLLKPIGFDYIRGRNMLRAFGYSPRSMEWFDD